MDDEKDVHTEHCCQTHGCKYGDSGCPIACGKKRQSFPCEDCCEEQREAVAQVKGAVLGYQSNIADAMRMLADVGLAKHEVEPPYGVSKTLVVRVQAAVDEIKHLRDLQQQAEKELHDVMNVILAPFGKKFRVVAIEDLGTKEKVQGEGGVIAHLPGATTLLAKSIMDQHMEAHTKLQEAARELLATLVVCATPDAGSPVDRAAKRLNRLCGTAWVPSIEQKISDEEDAWKTLRHFLGDAAAQHQAPDRLVARVIDLARFNSAKSDEYFEIARQLRARLSATKPDADADGPLHKALVAFVDKHAYKADSGTYGSGYRYCADCGAVVDANEKHKPGCVVGLVRPTPND